LIAFYNETVKINWRFTVKVIFVCSSPHTKRKGDPVADLYELWWAKKRRSSM